MSRIVEQKNCPTCGLPHPSGTVQKFEIPEVPVADLKEVSFLREDMKALGEQISAIELPETNLQPIEGRFKQLDENLGRLAQELRGHPKPTADFISHWEECKDCAPEWNKRKQEIQKEALKNSHPVFNEKFLEHLDSCPTCQPGWEKFKGQIAQPKPAPLPATVEPEPVKSKSWWD